MIPAVDDDDDDSKEEALALTVRRKKSRQLRPSRRTKQRQAGSTMPSLRHDRRAVVSSVLHLLLLVVGGSSIGRSAMVAGNPSQLLSRIISRTLRRSLTTSKSRTSDVVEGRFGLPPSSAPTASRIGRPLPVSDRSTERATKNWHDHRQVQQVPPSNAPAAAVPATNTTSSNSSTPVTPKPPSAAPRAPFTSLPTSAPPSTTAPSASHRPSGRPSASPSGAPTRTVRPSTSVLPSHSPSHSQQPSTSDAPSLIPSEQPSQRVPSALPSSMPSVTHQRLTQPFIEMVLDGVDRNWTNRDVTNFQTATSEFVTNFWNTVPSSPVFVARTFTNVIPGHVIRLDPQNGDNGDDADGGPTQSSSSISNNGTLYDPPDSPVQLDLDNLPGSDQNLGSSLGPLQLGYNQTVAFNILPPFVINPVSNELFLLPFLSNPRGYTLALAAATNNTGTIRIASIRIAPLPTNPPTPSPSFVAQDDKNIIIITVVITVTSLAMAGGYILYQGRVEQQEGLVSLDDSISYTEEDLYRQSMAVTRNPAPPSRWSGMGTVSAAREAAAADAEAASASVPSTPGAPPPASTSVAVGTMGAVSAVTAATNALSDLASAAVSAVQGLVSPPAPAPAVAPAQQTVPTLRFDGQLEEILETDESRTLSPSVHTATGSDAHNLPGTSTSTSYLGGGSAMGTEAGMMGASSHPSGGAGLVASSSGGTAELEGQRPDDSQQYQPRYPTYSSLPISVISDEADFPFQQSPYPTVSPYPTASPYPTPYPPSGLNVDPSWPPPDQLYLGADGAMGAMAPQLQQVPAASGIPIVTDLSLSTVLNSDEMDLPVSPLAMMGFQLEIQDLDDYGEGASGSGTAPRAADASDGAGARSRR